MNAETILRSDVLDIIFENRNKQYGAYELRREYNRRLYKAMSIMLGTVLLLVAWDYIWHNWKPGGNLNIVTPVTIDTVKLKQVDIIKEPEQAKPKPPVAAITNPPPVIVPDNQVKDTLHTVDEFENKAIGSKDIEGAPATSDAVVAQPEPTPSGTGTAAPEPAPEPEVLNTAELMPEFPGGIQALLRFLGKNLNVPEDVVEPGQRVKVPVHFVVNKDGNLSDVEFLTPADNAFKKEILRVMAKMPKWKPGSQHGKTVAVYFTIPIIFEVPEN
jgi:protein TonB